MPELRRCVGGCEKEYEWPREKGAHQWCVSNRAKVSNTVTNTVSNNAQSRRPEVAVHADPVRHLGTTLPRVQLWREMNRERYNEQQRVNVARYRAKRKERGDGEEKR